MPVASVAIPSVSWNRAITPRPGVSLSLRASRLTLGATTDRKLVAVAGSFPCCACGTTVASNGDAEDYATAEKAAAALLHQWQEQYRNR